MVIQSIDPATGEVYETFDALTDADLDLRLERAARAARELRDTAIADRATWMRTAAALLEDEGASIARTITEEMGKPLRASLAEVVKSVRGMRYYADCAATLLADEPLDDPSAVGATNAFVRYQPLGVVLAVMPWNFPIWQVVRFAAPSLMAGNAGLLKHASNVPRCALFLSQLFARGGFPEDSFQALLLESRRVEHVIRDRRVAAVTLTGSEPAGRSVASIAGDEIKPVVLELGGSDAFIVMPSADIEGAVTAAVTSRTQSNGQSCIAAKRFLVHDEVYDVFVERFVAEMRRLVVGDPRDEQTDVGPMATEQGREELDALVADAVAQGASVLCGGVSPTGPGWYYPPTVLADVTPAMEIHLAETFGPVATVYRVADVDAAIELANATSFGLGSNAWTEDAAEQDRFVAELEAGAVFVNGFTVSHPELPFGGIKRSGVGRELGAPGIRTFCNMKTVWVR